MIHPVLVDFYSDFDNNVAEITNEKMKEVSGWRDAGITCIQTENQFKELYSHDKEDVPVLKFHPENQIISTRTSEYFVVPLIKGEYRIIESSMFDDVKGEVTEINRELGKKNFLDDYFVEEWINLENFDLILNLGSINYLNKIPIEVSQREISDEEIESIKKLMN